jgi:hypothetical protein
MIDQSTALNCCQACHSLMKDSFSAAVMFRTKQPPTGMLQCHEVLQRKRALEEAEHAGLNPAVLNGLVHGQRRSDHLQSKLNVFRPVFSEQLALSGT